MAHSVVFAPEAEADLIALYDYIAAHGGPERALGYVERIVATCRSLSTFPARGTRRDDIRPGLHRVGTRLDGRTRRAALVPLDPDQTAQGVPGAIWLQLEMRQAT